MTTSPHSTGVLVLQLGTPDAPDTASVRRYLKPFLLDPRVIDLPAPARHLLVRGVILPFRPRKSAEAYRAIWTAEGSPLRVLTTRFARALELSLQVPVRVGMRYGNPSIEAALGELEALGCQRIVAFPQFPQHASATTGSALEALYRVAGARRNVPALTVVPPFFDDAGFIRAWAKVIAPTLEKERPDRVLFSYHGLPERQLRACDPAGSHCLSRPDCCEARGRTFDVCYRAQCLATTKAIANELGLTEGRFETSFQSRLGRAKWIEPYTDARLGALSGEGVKRLMVVCPAFTTEGLETLEEIGLRGREQFLATGGEAFAMAPSLDDHPDWIEAAAAIVKRVAGM